MLLFCIIKNNDYRSSCDFFSTLFVKVKVSLTLSRDRGEGYLLLLTLLIIVADKIIAGGVPKWHQVLMRKGTMQETRPWNLSTDPMIWIRVSASWFWVRLVFLKFFFFWCRWCVWFDPVPDEGDLCLRAEMSCGHAVTPHSLTGWCRSLLDQVLGTLPCDVV